MKSADRLAASGALLLLALQIGAGGIRPWAGRGEWDRIGAREREVAALEEKRDLEQGTLRFLESALGSAQQGGPSDAGPPLEWRTTLDSVSGDYVWDRAGPGAYRLEVTGRFEEMLDLLGLFDSDPGPYVVRSFELEPDHGLVRMAFRFEAAGGGR